MNAQQAHAIYVQALENKVKHTMYMIDDKIKHEAEQGKFYLTLSAKDLGQHYATICTVLLERNFQVVEDIMKQELEVVW